MKLRFKISVVMVGLVLAVLFSTMLVLYHYEKQVLLADISEKMDMTLKHFVKVSEEALIVQDDLLLLNYTNLIKKTDASVVYAAFRDRSGVFLAHTDPSLIYKKNRNVAAKDDGSIIVREREVNLSKRCLGYCEVGFSKEYIDGAVESSLADTRKRIYAIAVVGVFMGFIGAFFLGHTITAPIYQVVEGAKKIGGGDLAFEINIRRRDELGVLADEFNAMARKLKELDDMKRDFVASVTHELRSPLAAVQSYVSLLLEKKDFSREIVEESMIRIKNNTTRLGRFINDLLDVAKIEAGKLDISCVRMNIAPAITDVIELFAAAAAEKKIKLSAGLPGEKIMVIADEDRLRQVITNLVNNALKFTPAGGTVTVKAVAEPAAYTSSGRAIVSVSDTGIGIPKDALERIFSKFEQVKGVRDNIKGPKGTGLGLAIAKAIVEIHGGNIRVESEPGRGASFIFTVPMAPPLSED
ncbi:MAG: HAMP domain-containing sensor histidine kinase [Endomicrobiia bacterium]|nr:HAMP domain-containing sensor histidine kinase [Endomicrobiia bacterium]